ncbi:MAG: hypothetical protein ACO294_12645 [Methylococcales bacterium]
MNNHIRARKIKYLAKLGMLIVLVPSLTACQSTWFPESDFGSSVNQAIANQVANKNAPDPVARNTMGMEGVAAKSSIDSYQKSFESSATGVVYGSSGSGAFVGSSGGGASLPSISGK